MPPRDNEMKAALARRIFATAAEKGAQIGISPMDYLIGILEGQYPRFAEDELLPDERTAPGISDLKLRRKTSNRLKPKG